MKHFVFCSTFFAFIFSVSVCFVGLHVLTLKEMLWYHITPCWKGDHSTIYIYILLYIYLFIYAHTCLCTSSTMFFFSRLVFDMFLVFWIPAIPCCVPPGMHVQEIM